MTDTPASNSSASGAEFDMMAALDWKDGIATLPGSNIRVHILSDPAYGCTNSIIYFIFIFYFQYNTNIRDVTYLQ